MWKIALVWFLIPAHGFVIEDPEGAVGRANQRVFAARKAMEVLRGMGQQLHFQGPGQS